MSGEAKHKRAGCRGSAAAEAEEQRAFWNRYAPSYQDSSAISLDDFHYGPLLPGESKLRLFSSSLPAGEALELGCGAAQNSIWLASRGWRCTGVDISSGQLRQAALLASRRRVNLNLVESAMERFSADLVGGPFNLVHSVQALQFVRDPFRLLRRATRLLAPGGLLVLAVQHPLFAGEWLELAGEGFGLFMANYFRPSAYASDSCGGVSITSRSWPVDRWFAACRSMGGTVEKLLEPPALPPSLLATTPFPGGDGWRTLYPQLRRCPSTLILVVRF